ncbi:hypothetical protein BH09PSE6_BH09PSE6_25970 [soil metagenome]
MNPFPPPAPSVETTVRRSARVTLTALSIALLSALGGCDMLGIETPATIAAAATADGKAVGAACRHAGRAIEDCYVLNPKAHKAAVFDGWREMNDYMTKNKIEVVAPQMQSSSKQASNKDDPVRSSDADRDANAARTTASTAGDVARPRPRITAISEADIIAAKARAHTP